MKALVEPPEQWARPFLDWVLSRLRDTGYRGAVGMFAYPHAAIAAGHVTGLDYFYEYAIEAYYDALDAAEEEWPLAEPRWRPLLWGLDEEAEALAVFEEKLADSSTVLCAEPILAAAGLGLGAGRGVGRGWRQAGYAGTAGSYTVLARRRGVRCKVTVPGSVYALALAGLTAAGLEGPGEAVVTAPDPALLRKTVMDTRVAYGRLSRWLIGLVEKWAGESLEAGECGERFLKIRYKLQGLLEAEFEYLC